MILRSCAKENDVAQMLANGHWPQACAPELRTHIGACPSCADLIMVARVFQSARADAASAAHLGSPHALWWRAQLRRRNAAVERVGKPLLGAHIFALVVNLILVVGLLVSQARQGFSLLSWMQQLAQSRALHLEVLWPATLFNSGWSLMVMIPLLATLALVGCAAVYLASERQ
jgi:hypothetical protein